MRIFVTGSTGFLGGHVVPLLEAQGHDLVLLQRTPQADRPGVTVVKGALEDVDRWAGELQGCDAVIHMAGILDRWGPWERFQRAIVDATTQLIDAAIAHDVTRFVHISSESVLQAGHPLLDIDEDEPYPRRASSYYGESKGRAERVVLSRRGRIHVVVLRPTFIWGAGNSDVDDVVERGRSGGWVWFDGGRAPFEHVHVDNVANAVVAALTRGRNAGIYNITNGEPCTVREFFDALFAAAGLSVKGRNLPSRAMTIAASGLQQSWRSLRLRGRPPVTPFEIEFLALPRRYLIDRARADLGYQTTVSLSQGLAEIRAARDT